MRISNAIMLAALVSTSYTGCRTGRYRPLRDVSGRDSGAYPNSRVVTVYFVRHAQSIWNIKKALGKLQKNKGKLDPDDFADDEQVAELVLVGKYKNNIPDVGLSDEGIRQVHTLKNWLMTRSQCTQDALKCASDSIWPAGFPVSTVAEGEYQYLIDSENSDREWHDTSADQAYDVRTELSELFSKDNIIFGVSNLKRAIETMLIFLSGFSLSFDKKPLIYIVSALQEISGGTDAGSTLGPRAVPFKDRDEAIDAGYETAMKSFNLPEGGEVGESSSTLPFLFDSSANEGNYRSWYRALQGGKMLQNFCDWIYTKSESDMGKSFVVSGHSSWLQKLFIASFGGQKFGDDDEADKDSNMAERLLRVLTGEVGIKLGNGSVIKFGLHLTQDDNGVRQCRVVPQSTQLIFGNWQVHGECNDGSKCQKLAKYMNRKIRVGEFTCPKRDDE